MQAPGNIRLLKNAARAVALGALLAAPAAFADSGKLAVTYSVQASFDDVVFDLKEAIIERGLVIDFVSHIADMFKRTAGDVGATTEVFEQAEIYQFCSAVMSRRAMEADPANIAFCPYGVFVYTVAGQTGRTVVGYRKIPLEGNPASREALQKVNALLDEIVREAADAN